MFVVPKRLRILIISFFFLQKATTQDSTKPVSLAIDFGKTSAEAIRPIWRFFGYDEPNYTYMKDGKKLLSELATLSPVPVYVRTHNLLTTGNGTPALKWGSTNAYTEDASGKAVYSWTIVDSIFDTYIERGMRPLAQIGFMPEALSVNPESDHFQETPDHKKVYHYTGWNYPPKSYEKFATLVYEWVKHCINRYGKNEVEKWYWEVWNEPDISYWKGTTEEYIKLYDYAVDAVKRALPSAKVGGPETTNPSSEKAALFLRTFLTHITQGKNYVTGKSTTPLDFITFHAKGDPKVIEGKVWMDVGKQLRNIDDGFKIIASFPTLKKLPIIIGESDPEGCAACSEDVYPQNAYRNGTLYASYTAASFARKYDMAENRNVNLIGALTWAFEFENQPWFRGFRDLATNGVDKPVLNVFRMFGMMRGKRAQVQASPAYDYQGVRDSSVRKSLPDVNAFAVINKNTASVMIWNYHDENETNLPATTVSVLLKGLPSGKLHFTHYRVDAQHSNSWEAWKKMGSPQHPDNAQYKLLEQAGQLQTLGSPQWVEAVNGDLKLNVSMPRQSVSLLYFDMNGE